MNPRPTYTKPDKNQRQIIDELEVLGFDVDRVCDLPGLYDLIVSGHKTIETEETAVSIIHYGTTAAVRVEVKSEKGKLNETEQKYFDAQKHDNLIIARNTKDVTDWFGRE